MQWLAQEREHHRMISTVKAWRNIALQEPFDAFPVCRALPQRRVTATPTADPMGMLTALRFVVRLHKGADDVLEHVV
jgi:hypothetical protein